MAAIKRWKVVPGVAAEKKAEARFALDVEIDRQGL